MFVVWRGRGDWALWSVVFAFGAVFGLPALIASNVKGMAHHAWPYAVALALAGSACILLALDSSKEDDRVDYATGLRIDTGPAHSFYGIPLQFWGGVWFTVAGLVLALDRF